MLSKFDDYPIHQTAEPVFHTATSDRFVYDRYWYNAHAHDGSFYLGFGFDPRATAGSSENSVRPRYLRVAAIMFTREPR